MDKLPEGGMRLDKVVRRQEVNVQLLAQVRNPVRFALTAAVGEQDERNFVFVKILQHLGSTRDRLGLVEKDPVDTSCASGSALSAPIAGGRSKQHDNPKEVLTRTQTQSPAPPPSPKELHPSSRLT